MNPLFKIKICGITTPADAEMVCQAGADAIGINFFSGSKRYVAPETALQIADVVHRFNRDQSALVQLAGVVVNANIKSCSELVSHCRLDILQLHGDEHPEVVGQLENAIDSTVKVIRAIRTDPNQTRTTAIQTINEEIDIWIAAGADGILLDAAAPGEFGGTGTAVDWTIVPDLLCSTSLTLAGGLNPGNVSQAIHTARVRSIDVASGVESEPGKKSPEKVENFLRNANL